MKIPKSSYMKATEVEPGDQLHVINEDGGTERLTVRENYPLSATRQMIVTDKGPVQTAAGANVYTTRLEEVEG